MMHSKKKLVSQESNASENDTVMDSELFSFSVIAIGVL